MTQKVIQICKELIDRLIMLEAEVPFSLKLFIKLLLRRSKDESSSGEFEVTQDDAHLIADFLAGSWLSNVFKWPEALGMQPVFKEEILTFGHVFTACRLVTETCLAC